MPKVRKFLSRFTACLMICFVLSFTVAGDYLGVRSLEVYATGAETLLVLAAVIEAIMLGMGLSYSSTADLNNAAAGLNSAMNQYEDYTYGESSVKPFENLKNAIEGGMIGDTIVLDNSTAEFLGMYLYNSFSDQLSSSSDVVCPLISDESFAAVNMTFSHNVLENSEWFYNLTTKPSSAYHVEFNGKYQETSPVMITELIPGDGCATLNLYFWLGSENNSAFAVCDKDEDGHIRYKFFNGSDTSKQYGIYYLSCTYDYSSEVLEIPSSKSSVNYVTYYFVSRTGTLDEKFITFDESEGNQYRVFINTEQLGVYSSVEEYNMQQFVSIYRPSSKIYGTSTAAKSLTTDESGNVSMTLTAPSLTSQVEQAVNSAIAANPSITEDELNALASDMVAAQNGTTEAVNQNTATLSTLLTSILAAVRSIALDVSKISVSGDGTASLDWTDVQDAFDEVEVSGSSDNDNDDDEDDGKPKVWVPPEMKTVGFLAPLLMLLGGALSNLSSFQSAILGVLEGVEEWIMDIPENIADALSNVFSPVLEGIGTAVGTIAGVAGNLEEWIMDIPSSIMDLLSVHDLPLDLLLEGVLALPLGIADALEDLLTGDISIAFPDFLDYTGLLERIIELLESFLLIDSSVLSASLARLSLVWEDKLPFGDKLSGLYDQFSFPDTYVYPVIKVQTPDVLRTFYSGDYIVICDCEDYKQYFLWARNLVKAWLWFCFGLSIFNHLRADLHIS